MEQKLDPTVQTTKFVNVDEKKFDIYINSELARSFKPGEEQIVPLFVAQVGAKHLVDRILQEEGIRDTNVDSDAKKSLLSKILPEVAEEIKEKPLSEEEFRIKIKETLDKQNEDIEDLGGKISTRDDEIKQLKKELALIKARESKGRIKSNK